jgi:murein DD-endopeptidase MepM/ murein hydrolase activator NlpD
VLLAALAALLDIPAATRTGVPAAAAARIPAAVPSIAASALSTSDRDLAGGRRSAGTAGYALPLPGPTHVLRRFEPPPTPYSAGHRGVDLEASAGPVVQAAGFGVVSFAGPVAGRGVVVIAHPDGIRTEYEPVAPLVVAGQAVGRGQPIGRLAGRHDAWPPGRCLHWGARRGDTYLDPLLLLQPLGPVRLLPWPR